MIRVSFVLAAVFLAILSPLYCLAQATSASDQPAGSTEKIDQAVLAWFDKAIERVDSWKPAAEAVAANVIDGHRIYCGGNGGFTDEMFFRVGGSPFLHIWSDDVKMTAGDVVYYTQFVANEPVDTHGRFTTLQTGGRYRNNTRIAIASKRWVQLARVLDAVPQPHGFYFIDTDAPAGASIEDICVSQVASMATAWAFHGEVLAAATRQGKMLATYAGPYEEHPGQTDESVKDMTVNPEYSVDAIDAGKLGRDYLKSCREHLASLGAADAEQVRKGAASLAGCIKGGGMVWAVGNAHAMQRGMQIPGDLAIKNYGREFDWDRYAVKMPKGDAMLYLGYVYYPKGEVQLALKMGCPVVVISKESGPQQEGVTQIHLPIDTLDACVSIPKYPIKMLPISGVMHSVLWYDLMAEMEGLCTKK